MLLGARGEYLLTEPKMKALVISGFGGFTFGEIQAQPPAEGTTKGAPYVKSGLMGLHLGANFRYRFTPQLRVVRLARARHPAADRACSTSTSRWPGSKRAF